MLAPSRANICLLLLPAFGPLLTSPTTWNDPNQAQPAQQGFPRSPSVPTVKRNCFLDAAIHPFRNRLQKKQKYLHFPFVVYKQPTNEDWKRETISSDIGYFRFFHTGFCLLSTCGRRIDLKHGDAVAVFDCYLTEPFSDKGCHSLIFHVHSWTNSSSSY